MNSFPGTFSTQPGLPGNSEDENRARGSHQRAMAGDRNDGDWSGHMMSESAGANEAGSWGDETGEYDAVDGWILNLMSGAREDEGDQQQGPPLDMFGQEQQPPPQQQQQQQSAYGGTLGRTESDASLGGGMRQPRPRSWSIVELMQVVGPDAYSMEEQGGQFQHQHHDQHHHHHHRQQHMPHYVEEQQPPMHHQQGHGGVTHSEDWPGRPLPAPASPSAAVPWAPCAAPELQDHSHMGQQQQFHGYASGDAPPGQWQGGNVAQSRPCRNSFSRGGAPPLPVPPASSYYLPEAQSGSGPPPGGHQHQMRRRSSLRTADLQTVQQAHAMHQQTQQQHPQDRQRRPQRQQQQFQSYQFDHVDMAGLFPGKHYPDQLGTFLSGGAPQNQPFQGHGQYQGVPQEGMQYQMKQGQDGKGVFGVVYNTASSFLRNASNFGENVASFVTGGRSRLNSLSGEGLGLPSTQPGEVQGRAPPQGLPQQWDGVPPQGGAPRGGGGVCASSSPAQRERIKEEFIEVASYLHEVRNASATLNTINAERKPDPVIEVRGKQRRTMSGTVYPIPSPFEENSNVGIGNVFPTAISEPQGDGVRAAIDLEQFFQRCPVGGNITCIKWAGQVKGVAKVKKGKPKPEGKERQNKKFDHCCFVSMCLEDGFSNVSVKVFCTGRLQTTGCRDGSMSLLACRKISECLRKMSTDEFSTKKPLITGGFPLEQSNKYCYQAPDIVRLEKESVLGVFDLGFREKGFSVDMNELRCLLTHPDNSDRIYKVNVPQSDKKKKVDRFQGIGVYVNREFLGSPNNVFVSIFPTGKCTVTAAPSVAQANKVAEVIGKLVVDLFVQCRKRDLESSAPKRQRTKKKK